MKILGCFSIMELLMRVFCYPFILILLVACSLQVNAQNEIHLVKGRRIIPGRVLEHDYFYIRYYNYDDGDSSVKLIKKYKVEYVQYADGHIWRLRGPKETRAMAAERERKERLAMYKKLEGCNNILTLDFPTFMDISNYPGVVVGLGYERFVNRKGLFSATLSAYRYWAGTNSSGKLTNGETRANIQGSFLMPGILYHPLGRDKGSHLSIGIVIPIGSCRRYDLTSNGSSTLLTSGVSYHVLTAILFHFSVCIYTTGHFVIAPSISAGPMLPADKTRGAVWLVGLKLGGRF